MEFMLLIPKKVAKEKLACGLEIPIYLHHLQMNFQILKNGLKTDAPNVRSNQYLPSQHLAN
jgi:hypothetical protein